MQAYAGGSMEVQLSSVHSQESDGINNLIAARIKVSSHCRVKSDHLNP